MLATKFLKETLGKLIEENGRFSEQLQENRCLFSEKYSTMISDYDQFSLLTDSKKPSFFFAEPVLTLSPEEIQKNYTIAAVDGSQILSDDLDVRVAPFLLINIGLIKTNYPQQEVVKFDTCQQIVTDRNCRKDTAAYRTRGEFEITQDTIKEMQESNILLIDGGLLQWHLTENLNPQKEETLSLISQTFQQAKDRGVHMLGYISGTNASDVVGSLRVMHCGRDFDCPGCHDSFCMVADRTADENLYQEILPLDTAEKWNVSPLFKSNAPMISKYYKQNIFFFYLYNQFEFARVECTEFSLPHLSFLIGVLKDQIEKGFGYPIVLQEAHELAVLQKSDIITLEQYLVQQNKFKSISHVCRFKNMAKKVKYI